MKIKITISSDGFPIGRPRKGEIRPRTPEQLARAERYRKWRLKNKPVLLMYSLFWRLANLERSKEIARGTRLRKAAWKKTAGVGSIKL